MQYRRVVLTTFGGPEAVRVETVGGLLPDWRSSLFYNIHTRRKKHPDEFKADIVGKVVLDCA